MSDTSGKTLRVILRWIQVKDKLEPFFKDYGEFFFRTRVTSGNRTVEYRLPEEGHWEISDHPRFNRVDKIDKVLFEGDAGDSLVVELFGEEIDTLTRSLPESLLFSALSYERIPEGTTQRWGDRAYYLLDASETRPEFGDGLEIK
ncbi:MAG TPA: hypothetical protein RMF84_20265, partial [Polyangiaceae bacterium LLY-WYZ-14_1]|nr:hypothetical protein [Polyangiaceae bacterium LLY-WYZ-14_1]